MATPTNEVPVRPRRFDLSPRCGDNGHQLFLAELDPRATLATEWLPVAGEATVRADVALPGLNIVSIEIFNELDVNDPGGDPAKVQFRKVEFILGRDDVAHTTNGGLTFDGYDTGTFPGLDTDFNKDGELIAIRVERAGFIGS